MFQLGLNGQSVPLRAILVVNLELEDVSMKTSRRPNAPNPSSTVNQLVYKVLITFFRLERDCATEKCEKFDCCKFMNIASDSKEAASITGSYQLFSQHNSLAYKSLKGNLYIYSHPAAGFKIRRIFFGAQRSGGAVLAKKVGAVFEKIFN